MKLQRIGFIVFLGFFVAACSNDKGAGPSPSALRDAVTAKGFTVSDFEAATASAYPGFAEGAAGRNSMKCANASKADESLVVCLWTYENASLATQVVGKKLRDALPEQAGVHVHGSGVIVVFGHPAPAGDAVREVIDGLQAIR